MKVKQLLHSDICMLCQIKTETPLIRQKLKIWVPAVN